MSPGSHERNVRGRVAAVLAGTVIVVAGAATGYRQLPSGGGGPPPTGTANIWVQVGGGSCAGGRSSTPITLAAAASPDRICGTFDLAWDTMNAGDTARVVAGTYSGETINGDKTSDTTFIGENRDTTIMGPNPDAILDANHIVWQDLTFDQGATHGWGIRIQGNDITWNNVVAEGQYIGIELFNGGGGDPNNFTWDGNGPGVTGVTATGGSLGEGGDPVGLRCGDNADIEPLQINGGNGHHILDLTVWPQGGANLPCPPDGYHEEDFRIHSSNTTIERVVFKDGSAINRNGGSGKIFMSGSGVQNLIVRNVIFGPVHVDSNSAMDANVSNCTTTIEYSTLTTEGLNLGLCSVTLIHTIGPNAPGVPITGILSAGNAAINAAAATCTADTGGVDFEGQTRPQQSACDKGADEFTP